MCAQRKTVTLPCSEVVGEGDTTTHAVRRADGPELVERCCPDDRRLIHTNGVVDVVCSTVGTDTTQQSSTTTRVKGTVRFDDVVLDEWVCSPTVDRQVAVCGTVEGTTVSDYPKFINTVSSISVDVCMNTITNRVLPGFQPMPPTTFWLDVCQFKLYVLPSISIVAPVLDCIHKE